MSDSIGEKQCGPTHHFACDCREEMLANEIAALKAKLAVAREALEFVTKNSQRADLVCVAAGKALAEIDSCSKDATTSNCSKSATDLEDE